MLLAIYAAAALALALATPPPLEIQYTWSKSGFVVLRKELTISQLLRKRQSIPGC
jgi:hypothetical protein